MEQERYSVLFSSQTGNTKILAQAIAQVLPAAGCGILCIVNDVRAIRWA